VGNAQNADGTAVPAYATPGALTASIGGTFTANASGTTLTIAAVLTGSLQPGDVVTGTDGVNSLAANTTIIEQLTGPAGGAGTYELSAAPVGGLLNACTVTSASTVLNVSAVAGGVLQPGQTLADSGALAVGTMIVVQISGTRGGAGLYTITDQQTIVSEAMTTTFVLLAQIQPLSGGDLRHMDALNLQGSHRGCYVNGWLRGGVRVGLHGGDLITLPDQSQWLVTQSLEPWADSAGFTKCAITLQDGS
jgi:hypothetical protein